MFEEEIIIDAIVHQIKSLNFKPHFAAVGAKFYRTYNVRAKNLASVKRLLCVVAAMLVLFTSCKQNEQDYCSRDVREDSTIGLMLHGGILDKYDGGRVYISIVKMTDDFNWSDIQYFTGAGFSTNEKDELKVLEEDSCKLKKVYFRWLELNNQVYSYATIRNKKVRK